MSNHISGMTELHCPQCGKRSPTKIKYGEVVEYCKNCKQSYEVTIRIVQGAEKALLSGLKDEGGEGL